MQFELTKEYLDQLRELIGHGKDAQIQELLGELHPADIAEIIDEVKTEDATFIYKLLERIIDVNVIRLFII